MLRHRLMLVSSILAAGIILAGCSDNGDRATDQAATSTSADAGAERGKQVAYQDRGPYAVGVEQLSLDDGRRVAVWYPAAESAAGTPTSTFDIAALLSPELQAQIPSDLRPVYDIDAHPDAAPATDDGPYPLVLFSHGFAGFPQQSADLTTHLASWGFVVAAPAHVERSLGGLLGTAAEGKPEQEDPAVLSATLDKVIADNDDDSDQPLAGLVDTERVAVTGHSAGASAAYATASTDDRIDAFIAYSVGTGSQDDADNGSEGAASEPPLPPPEVPGMVMLGTRDGVIPPSASRDTFEAMNPPKYLVEITGAGHLVFSDICLIGKDQGGLVGLVDAAGLDLPDNLLTLAEDGCGPQDLNPAEAFGVIDHLSVAFLRNSLGIDDQPVGLAPAVTEQFDSAEVTLTAVKE